MTTTLVERVVAKIDLGAADECWEWKGSRDSQGYGRVQTGQISPGGYRAPTPAYRAVYELFVEPIPPGMQVDHLCRNHACVNPDHLEVVTQRENLLRGEGFVGRQARQTHCLRGHPLSGDNLRQESNGKRHCRKCQSLRRKGLV